jgi:hypothetical protein
MVLLVVAGSLGCSSPLVIRGRVVDDATARPIEGALVVATWIEHRGNHFACYHVETAQTSSDGTVAMTVTLAPPRERESSTPLAFPDIVVYARGYETSLARLRAAGWQQAAFHHVTTERAPFTGTERTRYLVPATMDRNDRITYLRVLADAADCIGDTGRTQALREALAAEAREIAVTDYDHFVARWLAGEAGSPARLSPVFAAVESRNEAALRAALQSPAADPNDRDLEGTTALMRACARGRSTMVEMLLDAGADPARNDFKEGQTALHAAVLGAIGRRDPASRPAYLAIVTRLLRWPGLDPRAPDVHGRTALDYATGRWVGSRPEAVHRAAVRAGRPALRPAVGPRTG